MDRIEPDVSQAERMIRTHCPIDRPHGRRYLNCGSSFPGPVNQWAWGVLTAAGYPEDAISKLDTRTGHWS